MLATLAVLTLLAQSAHGGKAAYGAAAVHDVRTARGIKAAHGAKPGVTRDTELSTRLETIRVQVISLQQDLLDSLKGQKQAQTNLKKIRDLMKLQQEERTLGLRRVAELEATVKELEARRITLRERIASTEKEIHRTLLVLGRAADEDPTRRTYLMEVREREKVEAPRRRVLANLTSRGLKDIEIMKVDLSDADKLQERIADEKQQLTYLFLDLNEKASVLELNRQLQADIIQQKLDERLSQLENYRKLKKAESQVEELVHEFNSRLELERTVESERMIARLGHGAFARFKGKLPMPLTNGKILSAFGRAYDSRSRLYVFKKGVDIAAGNRVPVLAIWAGKIAYSGTLPDYGQVTIVDHGEHFYSLCAHLGSLARKAGDMVKAGETLGETDDSGTPVYFEIRARNVAVNPLQWLSN